MPKHGIPRALTSFTPHEIKKLLYQGRLICTDAVLDIKALPIKRAFAKILIVTPKKIGSAPQRNLIKRRIKSLFYEEKLYERSHDFAVFCKKGSTKLSFQELKQHLLTCSAAVPLP